MNRISSALLLAATVSMLASCGGFRADITNPTVAQMDAQDVRWGLAARKPKGGVRPDSTPITPVGGAADATAAKPMPVDPSVIPSIR